ncbi:MAG: sigma-54-dependent Fis family transcriptional regulator [Pirellulaceae bacterium]|nr:sigma-54-dependent Fis family transcriptional regulator [Pirellulaceae bacterium]
MSLGKVIIVDDERSMGELLVTDLRLRGYSPLAFTAAAPALEYVRAHPVDVVLTDVRMPGTDGLELCAQLHTLLPHLPVIVMTAFGSMDTAVAALRSGAYDFLTKPIESDLLAAALDRAIQHHQLQDTVRRLSETVDHNRLFGELLGDSPAMQAIYAQLAQLAATDTSVLITGQSGTGKELIARSIHRRSRRASAPLVAVNCAALPEMLMESELFGHTKGAFTDARGERKGLFVEAHGGTLFLDEIGELPLSMQVKLLRVLEQRSVRPVGSDREIPIDVRLISATNRDLESAVENHTFREDLFYRINVIQIELPPLKQRGSDILLIAQYYIKQFAERMNKPVTGLDSAAAERLLSYGWPGNVRELRNVIERAVALTRTEKIMVTDLPTKIQQFQGGQTMLAGDDPSELVPLEEIERRYIQHVIQATDGNQSQAARILGVDRKTLHRKLKGQ